MTSLDQLLDSVRDTLGTDDLDSHPLVSMASAHGIGFLTGAAEVCANQAGEAEQHGADGQDFENVCLEAVAFLLMAIHARRLRDGHEAQSPSAQPNLPGFSWADHSQLRSGGAIQTDVPGIVVRLL